MNMHGFLNNADFRHVNAGVAAGSSIDDNSVRIDAQGADSILFTVPITDSVATGVAKLTVEQSDADSDTGMAAITGAEAQAICAVNDDLNGMLLIVEVRPTKRYVQGVLTSMTANIAFGDTIAITKPRQFPVTQGATVAASAFVGD